MSQPTAVEHNPPNLCQTLPALTRRGHGTGHAALIIVAANQGLCPICANMAQTIDCIVQIFIPVRSSLERVAQISCGNSLLVKRTLQQGCPCTLSGGMFTPEPRNNIAEKIREVHILAHMGQSPWLAEVISNRRCAPGNAGVSYIHTARCLPEWPEAGQKTGKSHMNHEHPLV